MKQKRVVSSNFELFSHPSAMVAVAVVVAVAHLVELLLTTGLEHDLVHGHGVLAGQGLALLGVLDVPREPVLGLLLHLGRVRRETDGVGQVKQGKARKENTKYIR